MFCAGTGSSPVNVVILIERALNEVHSAGQHYLEMILTTNKPAYCRVGDMVWSFSPACRILYFFEVDEEHGRV